MKGITNAGGGIPTGAVTNSMLANDAVTAEKVAEFSRTQYFIVNVGTEWNGDSAPYTRSYQVNGLRNDDVPKLFFYPPDDFGAVETAQDAFSQLYSVESGDGSILLYAKEKPAAEFSVLVEVSRI